MRRSSYPRLSGFTLIELLVAISIIILLIAILLPALRRAREAAIAVSCSTRIRDVGIMTLLYAQDHAGALPTSIHSSVVPGETRWPLKVAKYYNKTTDGTSVGNYHTAFTNIMFRCPTQEYLADELPMGVLSYQGMYGYNEFFTGGNVFANWRQLTDIRRPSDLPLFADANADTPYGGSTGGATLGCIGSGSATAYPHPNAYQYGWASTAIGAAHNNFGGAPNHRGTINYSMADNHVRATGLWPWEPVAVVPPAHPYYANYFHPKNDVNILPN